MQYVLPLLCDGCVLGSLEGKRRNIKVCGMVCGVTWRNGIIMRDVIHAFANTFNSLLWVIYVICHMTSCIIMPFHMSRQMPFRKLIPAFTLTGSVEGYLWHVLIQNVFKVSNKKNKNKNKKLKTKRKKKKIKNCTALRTSVFNDSTKRTVSPVPPIYAKIWSRVFYNCRIRLSYLIDWANFHRFNRTIKRTWK